MYGLVNQGVRDLALQLGGEQLWHAIKLAADVDHESFIGMGNYPDDVTYRLVDAASSMLGISTFDVLRDFGKHWVLFTAQRGYGPIFDTMGGNLPEFLSNLDAMHVRLRMSLLELRPPSFVYEQLTAERGRLEYRSDRPGLAPMVIGLLEGLGVQFNVALSVTHSVDRSDGGDHDEFIIDYLPVPPSVAAVELPRGAT